MKRLTHAFRWALQLALAVAVGNAGAAVTDALKAPRPKGGEWMGLYLVDKKVGYLFTDLVVDPADAS
ncbi:MAG TPA: hypothetical protein VH208_06275, partial [Myxococcaceae bacterium]|nr:hypothetical protein [Myxococcaceae bacterium]